MATKYFCDRCDKETPHGQLTQLKEGNNIHVIELCAKCLKAFKENFMHYEVD
jgi:DNA-directed RNA polymerase subunit RPC12/RpoP